MSKSFPGLGPKAPTAYSQVAKWQFARTTNPELHFVTSSQFEHPALFSGGARISPDN